MTPRLVAVCHVHGVTQLLTFNVAHFVRLAAFGPGVVVVDPASVSYRRRTRRCSRRGGHHGFRRFNPPRESHLSRWRVAPMHLAPNAPGLLRRAFEATYKTNN
jgi:hypothetical protein